MYNVIDAYKTAMHSAVQRFRLTGTVGSTEFTDENILSGSFSITNQCSGNNEIQIGQVYVGELDTTFLNLPLTRYSLKGMQITPSFGLRLADGTYEDVPLGVFNISEASWTMSGLVVKAYDNMSLLDKNCNTSQSNGTAYEMALLATEACGLTLGTTEAEFKEEVIEDDHEAIIEPELFEKVQELRAISWQKQQRRLATNRAKREAANGKGNKDSGNEAEAERREDCAE